MDNPKEKIINHALVPLAVSLILALSYFFIIYNRTAVNISGTITEPLFLYFAFLIPLVITVITSFFIEDKRINGAIDGAAVVLFSYIGTILQIHYNYSFSNTPIPSYYRDFIEAGSFELIFFFLGIFIIIGGYALGFLSRVTEPYFVVDKSIGQLSKAKRRKKKRKKAKQKKNEKLDKIVDEILED